MSRHASHRVGPGGVHGFSGALQWGQSSDATPQVEWLTDRRSNATGYLKSPRMNGGFTRLGRRLSVPSARTTAATTDGAAPPDQDGARRLDSAVLGLLWKGSPMTHICCPTCRLRFARATAAHFADCPHCGGTLTRLPGARWVMGFRLADAEIPDAVPIAAAGALTDPIPPEPQS